MNHTADYVPELEQCRIVSPQSLLNQIDKEGKFVVSYSGCEFQFRDKSVVSVPIQRDTRCPVMFGFNEVDSAAKSLAKEHRLLSPENQNLSDKQKNLLKWHFELDHTGFAAIQQWGAAGFLGKIGEHFATCSLSAIKCIACLQGKQSRTPIPNKTTKRIKVGNLYKNIEKPGELVYTDQFYSSFRGKYYNHQGKRNSHHK